MIRMLTRSLAWFVVMGGTVAVALSVSAGAQSVRTLPTFDLIDGDGSPISSDALPQQRQWLLVVAQRPCAKCEAALTAIGTTTAADRVVVVLPGAPVAEVAAMRLRHTGLANSAWYRDEGRAVFAAMGASGSPLVIGLSGNRIFWTRNVAAMSAGDIESLAKGWIQ